MDIKKRIGFRDKRIIDRTLPEVLSSNNKTGKQDILDLIRMIHSLGMYRIEINLPILKKTGKLPPGLPFLYRIDSVSALEGLFLYPFNNVVLNSDIPHFSSILKELVSQQAETTIEFRAETEKDLQRLKKLKDAGWMKGVSTIRITGLNRFIATSWLRTVEDIKRVLEVNIDICPENLFYNATAVAVDGIAVNGITDTVDYITASFMGYGGSRGYAAVEQILVFTMVMLGRTAGTQLSILPELAELFSKAAGVEIPENMPVIGKNIFVYESGIHADGIDKNPMTYEPYDPGTVGKARKLSIGKHSGSRSVVKKLQELGIAEEQIQISDFLMQIREKSISLHRNLEDNEIFDLLKSLAMSNIQ